MTKTAQSKPAADLSELCSSSFTVTFAIEILGLDIWHDCNEGWLDLGPCLQGMKVQYQLYPGRIFDIDILIWPHVAKIWCGTQCGWVRTWQFLERRWLSFSISNIFPVRVIDLRSYVATVTPTFGLGSISANAKNDKNTEAFLPRLKFGERRYFATVIEKEESIQTSIQRIIWNHLEAFIPGSYLDQDFDIPHCVKDIRHQDAVLYNVREAILNRTIPISVEESFIEPEPTNLRDRRESKIPKEKEKKKTVELPKTKFEIKLSGDAILAGVGRVIPFETVGDQSPEQGEIIALISTNNLPAQDDLPMIFVNVDSVAEVPVEEFRKARISHLYTRWRLGDEEHIAEPQHIKSRNFVMLNDHHALPLNPASITEITAAFLDKPFEIELRGRRLPRLVNSNPRLFGCDQVDCTFGSVVPKHSTTEPLDIILAVTKINARSLAKGNNGLVKGEFPLYPPTLLSSVLHRDGVCTNDINGIRKTLKPDVIVQPGVILQAQMSMDISIGVVGCKPTKLKNSFSRLYCLVYEVKPIMVIIEQLYAINEELTNIGNRDELITGFALDTGDIVFLYVEGKRDGPILRVWDLLEDFYGKVVPVFSSSDRYSTRLYPEILAAMIPFLVLKMYAPMGVILACPSVYARPALPTPTKSVEYCQISKYEALLKLDRLIAGKLRQTPSRADMPSFEELMSFKLELCIPRRTTADAISESICLFMQNPSQNCVPEVDKKLNRYSFTMLSIRNTF